MRTERWPEIERLYHSALELSPEQRRSYLERACGADEALRLEVESLLASDELAANFLETTHPAAHNRATGARIPDGTQIGPYVVVGFLRAGGMGEVYKARDNRLGRTVATKFLPAGFATDRVALERFRREARAASALNHPRICTVYDIGDHEGRPFMVMEFLEGGSLRDRIAGKPLPIPDLLKIAIQICEGLEAAHGKGIVHRDVKPSNVAVTGDGQIKILDFGIAQVRWEYNRKSATTLVSSEDTTTKTLTHLTRPGALTGTLAYLSPEQARGERVDSRSDIFSLGAVMYEMVTGCPPFQGETAGALVDAIVTATPAKPSESNRAVPKRLERIIEKALAKDPAARQQSARELARDLAALTISNRHRSLILTAAVAALLVSLFPVVWLATRPKAGPRLQTFTQLTDNPGEELYPSLSPDGKSFVYESQILGRWEIYLKRVGGQTGVSVTKDSGSDDTQPAFSPDGEHVAFRSERDGGGIFIMGLAGENVRRLTTFGYNPAWSPDGKELICSTGFFPRPEERPSPANAQL